MSAAGVIILLLLVCSGVIALILTVRHTPGQTERPAADGGDDAGGGGGGGSQPRVPPALPPSPSGIEQSPAWWPAFERDFAAYVRRREGSTAKAE
jgi:hypothetical protein